jgi:hypothetical protein
MAYSSSDGGLPCSLNPIGNVSMSTLETLTTQAVLDALALSGPDETGVGFIRTSPAVAYLDGDRLRLAREALAVIGERRATLDDVSVLADLVKPRIRELVQNGTIRTGV